MSRSKIEIIDTRILYWDPFRNRWFSKQMGMARDGQPSFKKNILTTAKEICGRFAQNRWDKETQRETTSHWHIDKYHWITSNEGCYDTCLQDNKNYNKENCDEKVHVDKWHHHGGPLHILDKKKLYIMKYGGKVKYECRTNCLGELIEESCSDDHYDWYPPREIRWRGG